MILRFGQIRINTQVAVRQLHKQWSEILAFASMVKDVQFIRIESRNTCGKTPKKTDVKKIGALWSHNTINVATTGLLQKDRLCMCSAEPESLRPFQGES